MEIPAFSLVVETVDYRGDHSADIVEARTFHPNTTLRELYNLLQKEIVYSHPIRAIITVRKDEEVRS